jgi:hypothetical protein
MLPLFVLTFSEEQEKVVAPIIFANKAPLLLSSAPVDPALAKKLFEERKMVLSEFGSIVLPLCGNVWPKTEEETVQLLCGEPKDLLMWRRRIYAMMAMAKNLVFVADERISSSQDLVTYLTVARIIRAKTLGIVPPGVIPAVVPNTMLAATDLTMSGEADATLVTSVLRSLTEEG